MKGNPGQARENWHRAPELPPHVFEVLHKPNRAINPIAIVATVDPDGMPCSTQVGGQSLSEAKVRFSASIADEDVT